MPPPLKREPSKKGQASNRISPIIRPVLGDERFLEFVPFAFICKWVNQCETTFVRLHGIDNFDIVAPQSGMLFLDTDIVAQKLP